MSTTRRTKTSRRRASDQATRAGDEIGLARRTLALSRNELARRAGVAWSTVERIEHGDPRIGLDILCAVAEAVGLDVVIRGYPGRTLSLRDTGQLELAELLRSDAHPTWHISVELPAGQHGEAADMAFFGPIEIIHLEIERMATDFQAQYRRAITKREALADQHRRPVRLVIAIEDTRRNRRAMQAHTPFVASVLPASPREVWIALRTGKGLGRDGLLWVRRPKKRPREVSPCRDSFTGAGRRAADS